MAVNFAYLGKAVTYPITITRGSLAISTGKAVIENSITMILLTPKGSRYMLPEFGSRIGELIFEPNDEILARLLKVHILEDLSRWEKRCVFLGVDVIIGVDAALCFIRYRILPSNEVNSYVFPFYKNKLYV